MAGNDQMDQDAIAAQWEASLDSEDPAAAAAEAAKNELTENMALQWAAMVEDGSRDFGSKTTNGERVLSQEEIDNLLGFTVGDVSLDDHSGIRAIIDSAMVSYERLPMLEIVFDRLVRLMTTSLRNFTSDNVEVSLDRITSVLHELDYLERRDDELRLTPAGQSLRRIYGDRDLLLAMGLRDGILDGWATMDGLGLVGRISGVGETTSRVMLLTDPSSRLPVTIQPSGQRALLTGDNTALPYLDFMESPEDVRPGDRVVTSGDGGLFPPGLLVGQAVQASDRRMRVRLAADYGRLEFLRVLRSHPPEQLADTGLLIPPPTADFIGPPMPPVVTPAPVAEPADD